MEGGTGKEVAMERVVEWDLDRDLGCVGDGGLMGLLWVGGELGRR